MREFEFVLTYEVGADELVDEFIERSMWRVDHVLGSESALKPSRRASWTSPSVTSASTS